MLGSAALALLLAAATPEAAVAAALALPGARAEVADVRAAAGRGCAPERWEAMKPVIASGAVALRLAGRDASGARCEGFAWAKVRVLAPALVALRAVRRGEPLAGAVAPGEAEVVAGRAAVAALPPGALADRALRAGAPIDAGAIRAGPLPGQPVAVVIRAGAVTLEQTGRAVACPRDRACAVLPSGRRVEGVLDGGRLLVEAP